MFRPNEKYLVIEVLGGLGNRMMALISAQRLAEMEQRQLWVSWPVRQGHQHVRFLATLNQLYRRRGFREISPTKFHRARYQPVVRYIPLENSRRELRSGMPDRILVSQLHGRLMSEEPEQFGNWHQLFMEKYQLSEKLQQQFDEFQHRYFADVTNLVGFQVRVQGHRLTRQWRPGEKFMALAEKLLSEDPGCKIFLSVDHLPTSRQFTNRFGSRILAIKKTNHLNTAEALENTILDCHLLAACPKFFGSPHSGLTAYISMLRNEPQVMTPP
jgi:hypothetical protein